MNIMQIGSQVRGQNDTYRIAKKLGEGGISAVWLVNRESDQAQFALKSVTQKQVSTNLTNKYFMGEYEIMEKLKGHHRNLVNVEECIIDEANQMYFFVLEYFEGGNLYEFFVENEENINSLSPYDRNNFILDFAIDIARGIQELHSMKICHRDLKPENIMVSQDTFTHQYVLKLLDFGISKSIDDMQSIVGTCNYMAQELLRQDAYNMGIDIWSFGCIVHEMITGEQLFRSQTQQGVIQNIGQFQRYEYQHFLSNIVERCLDINQERRIDAQNLLQNLLSFKEQLQQQQQQEQQQQQQYQQQQLQELQQQQQEQQYQQQQLLQQQQQQQQQYQPQQQQQQYQQQQEQQQQQYQQQQQQQYLISQEMEEQKDNNTSQQNYQETQEKNQPNVHLQQEYLPARNQQQAQNTQNLQSSSSQQISKRAVDFFDLLENPSNQREQPYFSNNKYGASNNTQSSFFKDDDLEKSKQYKRNTIQQDAWLIQSNIDHNNTILPVSCTIRSRLNEEQIQFIMDNGIPYVESKIYPALQKETKKSKYFLKQDQNLNLNIKEKRNFQAVYARSVIWIALSFSYAKTIEKNVFTNPSPQEFQNFTLKFPQNSFLELIIKLLMNSYPLMENCQKTKELKQVFSIFFSMLDMTDPTFQAITFFQQLSRAKESLSECFAVIGYLLLHQQQEIDFSQFLQIKKEVNQNVIAFTRIQCKLINALAQNITQMRLCEIDIKLFEKKWYEFWI